MKNSVRLVACPHGATATDDAAIAGIAISASGNGISAVTARLGALHDRPIVLPFVAAQPHVPPALEVPADPTR
jgi:hypothetical protein